MERFWPAAALLCVFVLLFSNFAVCAQHPAEPTQTQAAAIDQVTGTITGTITDIDGAAVSGARVTLSGTGEIAPRTTASRADGTFSFEGVHAGDFHLKAVADGLAAGEASGTLPPGGVYLALPIKLRIATANTELTVTPETQKEIAQQQIHQEEKQRVLGIVPNFYVSYVDHAAPLDVKQKFSLGLHQMLDPTNFLFAGAAAGVEQGLNIFPGYGSGPAAFGKRYGAALADSTSSSLFSEAVYPALLHQDPRYYYKGTGTVWQRTKYALETAVICKGDNGRWEANYSDILGSLSSGALANSYYAASDRNGVSLTFENALLGLAGAGVGHIFQEFLLNRFTTHVPPGTP